MHSVSLCQFGIFGGNQSCCLLTAATTCTKHAQTYRTHAEINSQTMSLVLFSMFVCWLLSWYVFGMLTPQLCIRNALWQAAATTAAIATLCTCNCSTLWSLFAYHYAATCTTCSGGATSYGCCDDFGHDTVTNDHLSQCRAQNSRGQFNSPQSIQLATVNSTCCQPI